MKRKLVDRQFTLVQRALEFLTKEILSDRLRPNQRISEEAVAKKLDISRSPVREALRILERDGLVIRTPNCGVTVADITPDEADELYLIHGHLMGLAVKLACQKMSSDDINDIEEIVRSLKSAAERDDRHGFLDIRARLERAIAERCLSSRLAHLLEVMGYPCARYRAFHVSVPGYMAQVVNCYEGICEAFRKRDETEAELRRAQIIELGRQIIRRYFIEPSRKPDLEQKEGRGEGV
ncbi:MAG: GntR family transcriptional regulator [Candidatus Binatia bacterium]